MLRSGFFLFVVQLMPGFFLVMLGWGFDNLSALLLNPARGGLAVVALAGVAAVLLFGLDLRPLRRGSTPAGNQSLQLGVLLLLSLSLLWFLPFADRRSILTLKQSYWRYLGLLLCCIGVTVRILALKALGEYFSAYVTLQPNHRLVRHGIYRSIRHPLYLSLLLVPTGIALVFASFLAFPVMLLAIMFVFDRIRKEERLLAAHFGSEFADYRRCAWKLLPHVL
jgi:protein-S-isoprenylcysteine O-methyltransferase Ste14